jgi:hypothetical protein
MAFQWAVSWVLLKVKTTVPLKEKSLAALKVEKSVHNLAGQWD